MSDIIWSPSWQRAVKFYEGYKKKHGYNQYGWRMIYVLSKLRLI